MAFSKQLIPVNVGGGVLLRPDGKLTEMFEDGGTDEGFKKKCWEDSYRVRGDADVNAHLKLIIFATTAKKKMAHVMSIRLLSITAVI